MRFTDATTGEPREVPDEELLQRFLKAFDGKEGMSPVDQALQAWLWHRDGGNATSWEPREFAGLLDVIRSRLRARRALTRPRTAPTTSQGSGGASAAPVE